MMEATWNKVQVRAANAELAQAGQGVSSIKSYLLVAFLVFIASAYLDNIRGPLLPSIAASLGEKTLESSAFLSLGNLGTFCGILVFATMLYQLPLRNVALLSWLFCGFVCLSALMVKQLGVFPLAFAIGLVIAAVQSVSNLLVLKASPPNVRSRNFCGLHLMFGVGSFFAPIAAAQVAERAFAWQSSLAFAALIFGLALALTTWLFPKDKAVREISTSEPFSFTAQKLTVLGTFLLYSTGQVLSAQWLMNYLRSGKNFEPAVAAKYVSLYFVVVTLSRLVSYFSVNEKRERFALNFTILSSTACLALGHLWPIAFIVSAVQAPFYPIYLGRMSRFFPESPRRITLLILLSAQVGLMLSHSLLAGLSDKVGIEHAYWLPAVAMLLAAVGFNFQEFRWNHSRS